MFDMIKILALLSVFQYRINGNSYVVTDRIYEVGDTFRLTIRKNSTSNVIRFYNEKKQYEVDLSCNVKLANKLFLCNSGVLQTVIAFKIYPLTMINWVVNDSSNQFNYTIRINQRKLWLNVYNFMNPFNEAPYNMEDKIFISCSVKSSLMRPNLQITDKAEYAEYSIYDHNYIVKVIYYTFGTWNTTISCDYNNIFLNNTSLYRFMPIHGYEKIVDGVQNFMILTIFAVFFLLIPSTCYLIISMLFFNSFLNIKDYMNDTKYQLENFFQV